MGMESRIFIAPLAALALGTSPNPAAYAKNGIERYRSTGTRASNLAFSDAVRVGDVIYLNNQIGNRPGEGKLVDGGVRGQLSQIILNIDGVLRIYGLTRANLVMCTVTLTDMASWNDLNHLWRALFAENELPARNVIGTTGLPLGAAIGVQCVAAFPTGKSPN